MKKINILIALLLCLASHMAFAQTDLWVGQTYQCWIEDYANRRYDWVNVTWDVSNGLYCNYGGYEGVKETTVSFREYVSGTHTVTARWTETKLDDPYDPWRHESHTWTFSCRDNPLELDETNISLSGNESAKIGYHFRYSNEYTSQAKLTYTSSNKNVATVSSDGVVTAKSDGTATITVKSSISKDSKTCTVKVGPKISVTNISLDNTSISLNEGDRKQLKATVKPDNATNKSVTWSSSNSTVASVDNTGYVTAKSAGTTIITCTANDGSGEYATCEVTVIFVDKTPIIRFADAYVKAICVENWDTNGDGNLSEAEAAAVKDLGEKFSFKSISTFNELQYFTGLTKIGLHSFASCEYLRSIKIPSSVKSIELWAFSHCKSLTSIEISNGLTSIDGSAFEDCSALTSIKIPTSVTRIIYNPFTGCSSLKSITVDSNNTTYDSRENCNAIIETKTNKLLSGCINTVIPNSVTSIGNWAFSSCASLTSIEIPNSVMTIGEYTFYNCTSLTSIEIPNSVTTIGKSAFSNCDGLIIIEIPSNVTTIGELAFNCSSLTSIIVNPQNTVYDSRENCNAIIETKTNTLLTGCKNTIIPNSVTTIGNSAFFGCDGLTSIEIPNSVTTIGDDAFYNCTSLTSIEIPNSVTTIGGEAFGGCDSLKNVYCSAEKIPITGSDAFKYSPISSATLHVPQSVIDKYKSTAPWSGFGTIVAIEEETSPLIQFADAKVKAICVANWDTNHDCELSEAEAAAVKDLGENFKDTDIKEFKELKYFTGLTTIGEYAFIWCKDLTSIEIPNSVTTIGDDAFQKCTSLTSIEIPNSVTTIGKSAFSHCDGLIIIEIPSNVTTIGELAFNCSSLTSIIVNPQNTVYDSRENCNAIIETKTNTLLTGCKNTIIPNSVIAIGDYAFQHCKGLTFIEIPNGVTSIGCGAFRYSGLISIEIPNSVTSIGWGAFCGTGLVFIKIPVSVMDIGEKTFDGCTSLTSIEIPNGVMSIERGTFRYCISLKLVIIPHSIKSIKGNAFGDCSSLENVYCYAENIPTMDYDVSKDREAFVGSSISSATLHVPQSVIDKYRTTAPWSEFGTIVAIEEISQKGDMDGDGNITVADITQLIEIYLNESNGINEIADLDGDGSITVSDITQLIEKYLNPEGENEIPVKSIILSVSALELAKGESEQMSATVSPTDATNPALQWSSSNTSVATVVDGLVTAIGEGTAIITCAATDGSGVEATCKVTVTTPPTTGTHNGHEWVDLGLSVKWATMNIGAYSPEDYGDYFAWGETTPKDTCSWLTYTLCKGSSSTMTKYCTDSSYGTVDNKSVLDPEDDAAHVNWGGTWRMPTNDECKELVDKCTTTWTTQNGVNGSLVTGPNGNSIFLPAAGFRYDSSLYFAYFAGSNGYYWSSSLYTDYPLYGWNLTFYSSGFTMRDHYRYYGRSVRAVCP